MWTNENRGRYDRSKLRYARVSTVDQNPELQLGALIAAGCGKVFVEKASVAKVNRAELTAALECMRTGDTLTVWKR
jgi:DNA invertase Pin-like site-specific DNA recombinase